MTTADGDAEAEIDAQLALVVVDGEPSDREASDAAADSVLVTQLQDVQQIMTAFDRLGMRAGDPAPPPSRTWGPYVLKETIGKGSFGVVYRGYDPAVARDIAVKLYSGPELPLEPRLMARVHHRNVVAVFGAAVHDGQPGIWMELVRGRTLAERVEEQGPLPIPEVIRIGIELCDALEAVHAAHLVHQDVKARNVMERDEGGIVLMDFGAGTVKRTGDGIPGRLTGTPLYMAPEVVLGKPASAQSDVYSLGVLLHYLLTGTYPVPVAKWAQLRERFERGGQADPAELAARIRELRPAIPQALAAAAAKALAPEGERYRSAEDVRSALLDLTRPRTPGRRLAEALRSPLRPRIGVLVLAAGVATAAWALTRAQPRAPYIASVRRLTWDTGLTMDPTRTADGKLLAYSSDRAGEGNLDIWLQQLVGGLPLRLTKDAADESQPALSPDGSQIAFRSERQGGGIYLMPTLGGEPRLVAAGGCFPRFSPDGRHIAYLEAVTGGSIVIVPVSGGTVKTFPVNALTAPTWSSDGQYVIVPASGANDEQDWWVLASSADAPPLQTGAFAALRRDGIEVVTSWPTPWSWHGRRVVFHARAGDSIGLWEVDLSSSTFRLEGPPRRLSVSTEDQFQPSLGSDGSLVFATRTDVPYLWELVLDADHRVSPTQPRVLIPHFPGRGVHDLSDDGRWMAFTSAVPGHAGIAVKDLETGVETALTTANPGVVEKFPVISRDGTRVLYAAVENGRRSLRRVSMKGGLPDKICEDCGSPLDWSPDGRHVLVQYGVPERASIGVLDLSTLRAAPILRHAVSELYRAGFSPDGRWITFHTSGPAQPTREFIAPFRGLEPIPERDWIAVTDGQTRTDAPRWSPDGNVIYYVSDADGYRCIWARSLDPVTKHPVGEAAPAHHVHGHKRPVVNLAMMAMADIELSVARRTVVYSMTESRGNIWLAEVR